MHEEIIENDFNEPRVYESVNDIGPYLRLYLKNQQKQSSVNKLRI